MKAGPESEEQGAWTLRALAGALRAELSGIDEPSGALVQITGVASAEGAGAADLIFAESEGSLAAAAGSRAGAVLTKPEFARGAGAGRPLLLCPQPRLAFAQAAVLLRERPGSRGGARRIDTTAQIAESARLGERVVVGAFAVVGAEAEIGVGTEIGAGVVLGAGVRIGAECRIYPRVVIYPGVQLGERVVIHAGAVLGADGFGYVRDPATGGYVQFPQQGTLVIEDDVEIGANSTVDRGALEETRIGRGSKLDNLVHVGHNVRVGENVVIAAQTGVSGSSTVGAGAVIGGQVGIADHVEVGEGVILGAQAGLPTGKRVRGAGVVFWGTPARPIQQYLKDLAALARLGKRG